jgi:hypothetical protein
MQLTSKKISIGGCQVNGKIVAIAGHAAASERAMCRSPASNGTEKVF